MHNISYPSTSTSTSSAISTAVDPVLVASLQSNVVAGWEVSDQEVEDHFIPLVGSLEVLMQLEISPKKTLERQIFCRPPVLMADGSLSGPSASGMSCLLIQLCPGEQIMLQGLVVSLSLADRSLVVRREEDVSENPVQVLSPLIISTGAKRSVSEVCAFSQQEGLLWNRDLPRVCVSHSMNAKEFNGINVSTRLGMYERVIVSALSSAYVVKHSKRLEAQLKGYKERVRKKRKSTSHSRCLAVQNKGVSGAAKLQAALEQMLQPPLSVTIPMLPHLVRCRLIQLQPNASVLLNGIKVSLVAEQRALIARREKDVSTGDAGKVCSAPVIFPPYKGIYVNLHGFYTAFFKQQKIWLDNPSVWAWSNILIVLSGEKVVRNSDRQCTMVVPYNLADVKSIEETSREKRRAYKSSRKALRSTTSSLPVAMEEGNLPSRTPPGEAPIAAEVQLRSSVLDLSGGDMTAQESRSSRTSAQPSPGDAHLEDWMNSPQPLQICMEESSARTPPPRGGSPVVEECVCPRTPTGDASGDYLADWIKSPALPDCMDSDRDE